METPSSDQSSTDATSPKSNASNHRSLHRALSSISANQTLVKNQRNILAKKYYRTSINDEIVTIDHEDANASFTLPNIFQLTDPVCAQILENLLDLPTMKVLEETKRLNWWVNQKFSCPALYPLMTSCDGNCLLHATSLAMWGFHDHALSMRKALNETFVTLKANSSVYRRWRWAQSIQNKKYKLVYSEDEWNGEWEYLLRLSTTKPRIIQRQLSQPNKLNAGGSTSQLIRQCYESLEGIHVYVLANIIRRPIIIYSETMLRTYRGEALSPIEFGGIYLPLEIPPEKCYKHPVYLTFDAAHFSALVPMESDVKSRVTYRIPLIDLETMELFPIHFFTDPGLNFQWPTDEELSDEKIHLYPTTERSRMHILGQYLDLSKEHSPLHNLFPASIPLESDSQLSATEDSNSALNEVSHLKKTGRSSFNIFSKRIRRKILQPFSSTKRLSLKHHHSSVIGENLPQEEEEYPPLFDPQTNVLTIILANFQSKRPEISEHMIQNYIETFRNENRSKQSNRNDKYSPSSFKPSIYYRHHTNTAANQASISTDDIEKNKRGDEAEPAQRKSDQSTSSHHLTSPDHGISKNPSPTPKSVHDPLRKLKNYQVLLTM